jgi:hypothetical protein
MHLTSETHVDALAPCSLGPDSGWPRSGGPAGRWHRRRRRSSWANPGGDSSHRRGLEAGRCWVGARSAYSDARHRHHPVGGGRARPWVVPRRHPAGQFHGAGERSDRPGAVWSRSDAEAVVPRRDPPTVTRRPLALLGRRMSFLGRRGLRGTSRGLGRERRCSSDDQSQRRSLRSR